MTLARNYTLVGSATLASRLTGFVRDIMIAAVLGSSAVADAYFAAFLLPNLFRRVLSEGAFNAAFVPIYARRRAEGGEDAAQAFAESALSGIVALVFAGLLIVEIAMPQVIAAIAPGFRADPAKMADAVEFSRIAFVFVGILVITALVSSLMNAIGKFAVVALAPLILNILMIGTLAVLLLLGMRGDHQAGLALVITVCVAGIAQFLYVAVGARRSGIRLGLTMPSFNGDVGRLLVLALPGLLIAGAGHLNMLVAAQMSSALPAAVSWLYYADRVFQLPLGFVASAIGTVLLPEVARALQSGKLSEAHHAGCRALEFGLLLVLPAAIALVLLAGPIVDLLFRRGVFSLADSVATAEVLRAIAFGLPGFVLVKVFLPPFLARERLGVPIAAALSGVAVNIVLTLILLPRLGHVAPALGVAASAWVNALVLGAVLALRRLFALDGAARTRLPRILLCALITGGVTWLSAQGLLRWLLPDAAFAARISALALVCMLAVAGHLIAAHWLGALDLAAIKQALRRDRA